ncbi:MAG: response regulator transcription factor [Chloroflexi bacterium]|nr:response regulator transcription factor [Chloroflexota bacterium]
MNPEEAHIRVLLAEDHALVRQMTRRLLENADFQVVAEAADGVEAVALTIQHVPDVVLMDFSMPRLRGLEATREIKRRYPHGCVLILTAYDDDECIFA